MFVDQRSQSLNLCALAHVVKWKLEILGSKAWGEDKVNNAEAGGEVKCLKYLERERGRLSGTDCHERVSQTNFGTAADFCTPVMLFPDKFKVWNCKRFFPASRCARVNDRVHVGYPGICWTLDSLLSCGQCITPCTLRLCMTRWKPMCRHSLLHSMLLQQVPDWKLELLDNFDISSFRSCWGVIEDDPDHFMIINP